MQLAQIILPSVSFSKHFWQAGPPYSSNLQYVNFNEILETNEFLKDSKLDKKYNLVGVIDYYGNRKFGHYTANCKNLIDSNWYYIYDENITPIKINDIKSQNPLILFYEEQ